jgi:integrase/recombinase XerC
VSIMDYPELTVEYLKFIRSSVSKQTYCQKEYQLKWFYKYLQASCTPFDAVGKNDIEAYLVTIKHCKTSTRRDRVIAVRDFYRFAISKYLPDFVNPVDNIRFRNYKKPAVPVIPAESFFRERLQRDSNCDTEQKETALRNHAMAELAYGSSLRRGELEAVNIEDIDFENRRAYICGKGGYTRIVPLTVASVDAVCRYIAAKKATRGPLFVTSTGKRLSCVGIGWIFRKKIGIRPHLMRHACATHLLKNGCNLRFIQELLGHRHLTTTQVYTHIMSADVAEAVKKLHPRSF